MLIFKYRVKMAWGGKYIYRLRRMKVNFILKMENLDQFNTNSQLASNSQHLLVASICLAANNHLVTNNRLVASNLQVANNRQVVKPQITSTPFASKPNV